MRAPTDTHRDNDSDEAVKVRAALRRFCERYAYQTRQGTDLGADLVLDELVLFFRTITLIDMRATPETTMTDVKSNWCARCGTRQESSRLREPTDPSMCFERNGRRYTNLVQPTVLCDPCAYALTLVLY
jgi:hypothetical protein